MLRAKARTSWLCAQPLVDADRWHDTARSIASDTTRRRADAPNMALKTAQRSQSRVLTLEA
jgi:hypothetical protein